METRGSPEYDVFISYAHADRDWVAAFARRLGERGLTVAWDGELITLGDLIVVRVEEFVRASANGILVHSPASAGSAWVRNEYAAMMKRAIEENVRVIPVLIGDGPLPPLAGARAAADFRQERAARWDETFERVVRALRTPL
ncbi:toll/interleukin-1 receptor domain-containing protein [Spongiactinospora sp. TRM90649]|uniref:toll/interleukin-1 receptor domain-containing protein n=1 Tax=Spongiactinospora sp. TRM90649 TaxID=3031114 RepID=UPI0023F6F38D|nr:toll/interleukin-1 receptor domain-containing protein [Spongiactinospora sp. TRM90649]MDF5758474.1 toll/interleukin-1 receptor domain-containing protein [Spongiactinospora sp. TRM90649]